MYKTYTRVLNKGSRKKISFFNGSAIKGSKKKCFEKVIFSFYGTAFTPSPPAIKKI